MSQTAYTEYSAAAKNGMLADLNNVRKISRLADATTPIGVVLSGGSDLDKTCKVPAALADLLPAGLRGVSMAVLTKETISGSVTFATGDAVPICEQGKIWVLAEENVDPSNSVYVRFATGIIDNTKVQKGAVRASPDGVAQVVTLTPVAVNTTNYNVTVQNDDGDVVAEGQYTSDGSATAAEIVTGLKAALGTVPDVTLSGTTTLILTSAVLGKAFSVSVDPGLTQVNTTPNQQSAGKVKAFRFLTTATAGNLVQLQVG